MIKELNSTINMLLDLRLELRKKNEMDLIKLVDNILRKVKENEGLYNRISNVQREGEAL